MALPTLVIVSDRHIKHFSAEGGRAFRALVAALQAALPTMLAADKKGPGGVSSAAGGEEERSVPLEKLYRGEEALVAYRFIEPPSAASLLYVLDGAVQPDGLFDALPVCRQTLVCRAFPPDCLEEFVGTELDKQQQKVRLAATGRWHRMAHTGTRARADITLPLQGAPRGQARHMTGRDSVGAAIAGGGQTTVYSSMYRDFAAGRVDTHRVHMQGATMWCLSYVSIEG